MIPALFALIFNILTDQIVFYEFILILGASVSYGFAIVFGLPAYFLYFRKLEPIRILPFAWFTLICLLGYCILMGSLMVAQDGVGALLSPTFIGYGLIFFASTSISVLAFYLIAFQSFGGKRGTIGIAPEK